MQFEQLGPYKIGKRLGRGGMGAVFEGVNVDTGESAAVKVLGSHLAEDEGFRERFELEIETLKKLRHPNIVRMYGYGEQDGYLFYAMELVKGHSVEEELQLGRRFTWREVVHDAVLLCKALRHAHDHGVIHRDIKPANLLVPDAEGEIKLTDFGIARLFGNNRLTMDGALVGTAEYMSPEQAAGERVTPLSDLYSLGGVMFAMLAGRPPFRTPILAEMLNKQRFETAPPVSQFVTGIPPELDELVGRLLSKDPRARAANALVLGRQLGSMEYGLSIVRQRGAGGATNVGEPGDALPAADLTVSNRDRPYDPQGATRAADPVGVGVAAYDPNAPTLLAPSVSASPAEAKSASPTSNEPTPRGAFALEPQLAASPATVVQGRFTTIEEDERQRVELERESDHGPAIIQIVLLTLSLAMIIGLLWFFTRPPSADKLLERIEEAARKTDPAALLSVDDDVKEFLERFPDDERAATVKRYREEIDLQRLEQRFRRERLLAREDSLAPVERDYMDAMSSLGTDPQRTTEKLSALVELYGRESGSSERTAQCVELARRQLQQLREQAAKSIPQFRAVIDANLSRAERLRQSSPEQARTIWQSIITLYGDKTWAAPQVVKARAALAESADATAQSKNDDGK